MSDDGAAVRSEDEAPGEGKPSRRMDPDAIAERIRERASRIERREREKAIEKLEHHGEVTDEQRAAVAEMTAGIVEELLSTPETALSEGDPRQLRAAMRVYGLDPGGSDWPDDSG